MGRSLNQARADVTADAEKSRATTRPRVQRYRVRQEVTWYESAGHTEYLSLGLVKRERDHRLSSGGPSWWLVVTRVRADGSLGSDHAWSHREDGWAGGVR